MARDKESEVPIHHHTLSFDE